MPIKKINLVRNWTENHLTSGERGWIKPSVLIVWLRTCPLKVTDNRQGHLARGGLHYCNSHKHTNGRVQLVSREVVGGWCLTGVQEVGFVRRVVLGSLELEHRKLLGMLANPSQCSLSQEDDRDWNPSHRISTLAKYRHNLLGLFSLLKRLTDL